LSGDVDGIRSPFLFNGLIREAVHQFKYSNLKAIAPSLAKMLYGCLVENALPGDVLVPVPLHQKRWRERGYNQSALLAQELARICGIPVIDGCLARKSLVISQAKSQSVTERRKNVEGVFYCKDRRISGKQVILVDDVSTSGATANSCAAALKSAGALKVWGLVVALEY
jgi:ComF family protein